MMEIWSQEEEARRLQLRFDRLKASDGIGQAKFARTYNLPGGASMITQHLKQTRPINLKAAKAYAQGFGCSIEEISPRIAQEISLSEVVEISSHRNQKTTPDELVIPQFESGGSMGRGLLLRDQPGVIRGWTVNQEWIQKNVPSNSGSGNLCIVTGFGPSMRPLFNPGDPLLVDRGVTSYQGDAIYFFRVGDEGFIKSLQSIPGQGFRVISANRDHFDPWTITEGMDFEVFGRVLKVWKGEDF